MPITVEINPKVGYVRVVYSGQVTDAEFIDYANMVARNDELLAMRSWLLDGRDLIVKDNLSAHALRQASAILAEVEEKRAGTRVAFVAPADTTYGVSRMFQLLQREHSPVDTRVFRDIPDALAWLGLPA